MRTIAALLLVVSICQAGTEEDIKIAMAMANAVQPKPAVVDKPIEFDFSNLKPSQVVSANPFRPYHEGHTCWKCGISYSSITAKSLTWNSHYHECPSCHAQWWHMDGPGTSIRR